MKLTYFKNNNNFIYLSFRCAGSLLRGAFSSCGQQGLLSGLCAGFSLQGLLLLPGLLWLAVCGPWGVRASAVVARRISDCGIYITGWVVLAHGLTCSAACAIFWIRDQTYVSCFGRLILYPLNHQKSFPYYFGSYSMFPGGPVIKNLPPLPPLPCGTQEMGICFLDGEDP